MRQIFFLIIVISLTAASCSKRCWTCTLDTNGVTGQEKICGKNEKEIKELEATPQETKNDTGKVLYITTYSNCTME